MIGVGMAIMGGCYKDWRESLESPLPATLYPDEKCDYVKMLEDIKREECIRHLREGRTEMTL